jgi:hypothetical protein
MSRDPFTTAASVKQWRSWQRRAETIREKGQALMLDMVEVLGPEHEATDSADNIVHAAEFVLTWTDRGVRTDARAALSSSPITGKDGE